MGLIESMVPINLTIKYNLHDIAKKIINLILKGYQQVDVIEGNYETSIALSKETSGWN